ncbi:hypothetical protein IFR05_013847 [Cadophora sp. M221]|nr:hypothetical protein IFR05_013847 [Cadophora sp. M221]
MTGEVISVIPDVGPLHLAVEATLVAYARNAPAHAPGPASQAMSLENSLRHLPANDLFREYGIDQEALEALQNVEAADPYSANLFDRMVARTEEATANADARGDNVHLPVSPTPMSDDEASTILEESDLDPGPWENPYETWGSP